MAGPQALARLAGLRNQEHEWGELLLGRSAAVVAVPGRPVAEPLVPGNDDPRLVLGGADAGAFEKNLVRLRGPRSVDAFSP